ncbi:MAG TPA: glycoside hydrolase domain-containing protein [Bryobacteraceae bacterium]|nr:glycoside hydrolase domain-containing protein [Bryobacteraceae bacterium]
MAHVSCIALLGAAVLAPLSLFAAVPELSAWTANEFERVRPADAPRPLRAAHLEAARNEYAPFQIVVRAGKNGLRGVNASTGAWKGPRGATIPSSRIALYREHYVEVTKASPKSKAEPGWYPDALIPFVDPATGKPPVTARFPAAPFDVPANSNQPLWVDVLVPRDAAAGDYKGDVTITAAGGVRVRVPVRLTVWDFALPDTPSMRTHFGDADLNPLVSRPLKVAAWENLDERGRRELQTNYAELVAAHRICPPVPTFLLPKVNPDGSIDPGPTHAALKNWMERFHITGFPIRFLDMDGRGWRGDPLGAGRERNARYLRSLHQYLRANGWDRLAYVYVVDEPSTREAYEEVRARARFVRETAPGIKVLCTEQPQPQDPAWRTLAGSVDIWVPIWPQFDEGPARERLAAGDELWSYTALCQGRPGQDTPFWQLDFPLLNYRVPAWISWRHGITGLLYWSTTNWMSTADVWTNPLTYREMYNLEGSLLYPGADAGVRGLVSSMRLKQIREGLEDYEYFRILAARRGQAAADEAVRRIGRSWRDWDPDPVRLLEARAEIARLIVSK